MLTLQFIPYNEIDGLSSDKRISKLLKAVKANKIVLLEGRLKPEEEAELIQKTMEQINDNFKGIELSAVNTTNLSEGFIKKLKTKLVNLLLGNRHGLTIIGPAKIIKEIKQDPDKIQLFTEDLSKK
ncbi:DUF2073 domain-containing protein [Candidatus Woesearchaeota archaeon]|nr:DUF2073 domain-containing protein [Candidatus Woesearchaeota archaeon]